MRTPTPMIVGIVLGPCGLVLNLTSTLAPNWRGVSNIPRQRFDLVQYQGLWDICNEFQSTNTPECKVQDTLGYFSQPPVQAAKGLMPSSLVVTALGLLVASLGVRCWQDIPHFLLAGIGGLVLFISGLLSLIAVSWYNHELYRLPAPDGSTLQVSYSLVLGYLGSCLEIIGGISLTFSFAQCRKEPKLKEVAMDYRYPPRNQPRPATVAAISPSTDSGDFHFHYDNSLDVLDGEWPRSSSGRHDSGPPCDSDL